MTATATYRVEAYNTARESENKIHDDTVARRYGFRGGLVPGVDVFAYMTEPVVERWGLDWLTHGTAACRFLKPVYDGAEAEVTAQAATDDSGRLDLAVHSAGALCATGWAALDDDRLPAPSLDDIARAELPSDRPPASPDSLAPGRTLGTFEIMLATTTHAAYLADVREPLPIYRDQGIAHPGFILRVANRVLTHNVELGPWIHVSSDIQNFGLARQGDRVTGRAAVVANYEKKGHRFVELDVIVAAGERVVARIGHTAIYQPRANDS